MRKLTVFLGVSTVLAAVAVNIACSSSLAQPPKDAEVQRENAPEYLTSATVGETSVELGSIDDSCAIKRRGETNWVKLDVSVPCGFVRASRERSAQTYFYDAVGHVLVVAGPRADVGEYAANGRVGPEHACSNEGQPIFVREKAIRPGESKQLALGFCHHLGFDEKYFYGFAFPPK